MQIPAILQPFIDSTTRHFGFLADYGFRMVQTDFAAYEAWVIFESATTRVTVTYELGSPPWVTIARLESRNGKSVALDEISLELLLQESGKEDVRVAPEHGDIPNEVLDSLLSAKAASLREGAGDLLRGNFESSPNLMKKVEENLRRRNLELFGTENGETK